ncbi:hypothetical protein [Heyndrickxia oleronia]|uniref:hypothetical protein n=1 Tax=Heyndrickxia oleronia TaxID=38875 RepID=UPI001B1568E5|nr:hypothetical protein [Heyndrickxia oleronia]GIN37325.1 hypothetical protein J19TS1_02740 [Heyndrickxia oleronia]
MSQQTIQISKKNQIIELRITQMAIYLQSKIIEAMDNEKHVYYLFFYKNHYITYVKPSKLKRKSFISEALTKGLILPPNHPLVFSSITLEHPFKKYSFQQLIKKAENLFTPQEVAFLTTFFESFISKKTIFSYIQTIFYDYRRNGKMFSSYRILRILMDFCPNESWVKGIASDLNFIKYSKLYDQLADVLIDKDPLYMENRLFQLKENKQEYQRLEQLLKHQSRWMDLIGFYLQTINVENYPSLFQFIQIHLPKEDVISVLEDLIQKEQHIPELINDLLDLYIENKDAEKLIQLLIRSKLSLTTSQAQAFEEILNEVNLNPRYFQSEQIDSILAPLFHINPEKAKIFLHQFITLLLKEQNLDSIIEYLEPLKGCIPAIPILKKIEQMQKLSNDPDQQLLLGQLFYEFGQYDQAIDCFSWEMELKAYDPKPVKWLAKLYNEIGMNQEHQAYTQLYIDMQKRA